MAGDKRHTETYTCYHVSFAKDILFPPSELMLLWLLCQVACDNLGPAARARLVRTFELWSHKQAACSTFWSKRADDRLVPGHRNFEARSASYARLSSFHQQLPGASGQRACT